MKVGYFLLILLVTTSCGVKVQTLYDQKVDFKKYKTFCWLKGCEFTFSGPAYLNQPETRERIQRAIVEQMKKKGYVMNADQPDLLLDVHVTVEDEKIVSYHRTEGDDIYYRLFDEPNEIQLLKGTLVIDMADKNEGRMVWRSVAVSYMDIYPELTEKNIQRGVKMILKKFPPEQQTTPLKP